MIEDIRQYSIEDIKKKLKFNRAIKTGGSDLAVESKYGIETQKKGKI